jgi:hypothetical protein
MLARCSTVPYLSMHELSTVWFESAPLQTKRNNSDSTKKHNNKLFLSLIPKQSNQFEIFINRQCTYKCTGAYIQISFTS